MMLPWPLPLAFFGLAAGAEFAGFVLGGGGGAGSSSEKDSQAASWMVTVHNQLALTQRGKLTRHPPR